MARHVRDEVPTFCEDRALPHLLVCTLGTIVNHGGSGLSHPSHWRRWLEPKRGIRQRILTNSIEGCSL